MNWMYANKFGELPPGQAEQVEALVAIAEQLEQLNKHLLVIQQVMSPLKITGSINTVSAR